MDFTSQCLPLSWTFLRMPISWIETTGISDQGIWSNNSITAVCSMACIVTMMLQGCARWRNCISHKRWPEVFCMNALSGSMVLINFWRHGKACPHKYFSYFIQPMFLMTSWSGAIPCCNKKQVTIRHFKNSSVYAHNSLMASANLSWLSGVPRPNLTHNQLHVKNGILLLLWLSMKWQKDWYLYFGWEYAV